MEQFYHFLYTIGLHTYFTRGLFGLSSGYVLQSFIQPSISYTKSGDPKTFILFSTDEKEETTYIPWYFIPILFGLFFAFVI